ncbi:hypothetical protein P175DRAFT_0492558 [Aspergillus ochraceoroseus IBT 24754]|uniref:Xylanolytic transcriptional activator regulatory domain-containing protein n=1 Tax=Aspergillus ochraceoroseus IBT 24754 TaxID=1392256 RepID=A0A2T5M085_9EURO|nr:uncharacterized protein P175DRAFT_0492558 [Aspergillus ochraceoroseus IBT 24754]PTU21943.1 hypothetical protein P175DRAFT_0492558 [Aspergillus ochraceoroseus IBT 24754]
MCAQGDLVQMYTRQRRKRGRIPKPKSLARDSWSETTIESPGSDEITKGLQSTVSARMRNRQPVDCSPEWPPSTDDVMLVERETCEKQHLPMTTSRQSRMQRFRSNARRTKDLPQCPGVNSDTTNLINDTPLPEIETILDSNRYDVLTPSSTLTPVASGKAAQGATSTLKYPVLQPIIRFLEETVSQSLAFDLIDIYFTSAFSTHMHPACHHIHCFVLRKASFITQKWFRPTSPALLASMLWVAALDDRVLALISRRQRKNVCEFLSSLTVQLLKPLTHTTHKRLNSTNQLSQHSFAICGGDWDPERPVGSLDDVITYIHIASIVSASEQKATSMRWWYAAFTLARELKLNREVEAIPTPESRRDYDPSSGCTFDYSGSPRQILDCVCVIESQGPSIMITEEQREERRRVWWLLYIMDRHLALCYHRPLVLLDAESKDLLLPTDEEAWQAGNIHSNSPKIDGPHCLGLGNASKRRVFLDFTCHDHSIFGFFLPLMAIMGQLIDLNRAQNHPTLGATPLKQMIWEAHAYEIHRQIDDYMASLDAFACKDFGPQDLGTPSSPKHGQLAINPASSQAHLWLTQTVVSYASYFVHVLHILLNGKWDLISLIEDKDFWTSSPNFASTISHTLNAAESVNQILRFDPDVSFLTDFFGVQLLQGSFPLLLLVERLQQDAGESTLNACEVILRATESCIVTLGTEYQRNFRQVMRSAVAQARGRPVNSHEIRRRHQAILGLYRWTGTGTGLAL